MKTSITQEDVDAQIVEITVSTIHDKVTVVAAKLRNGFVLVESAGAVDKANYSEAIGRAICLERIKAKIWDLEGYRLASAIAAGPTLGVGELTLLDHRCRDLAAAIEALPAGQDATNLAVLAELISGPIHRKRWLRQSVT